MYGERLKYIRTMDLITQKQVADAIGISRSAYNSYERQDTIIPIKRLNEFANYFNVSIDYIFGFTNKEKLECERKEIDKTISGKRLKEIRKEFNLTQYSLADQLGTVHTVIYDYERGRYIIATPFLYDICKTYKISADWLLGRIDSPNFR